MNTTSELAKALVLTLLTTATALCTQAQPKFSQPHGLYDASSLTVAVTGSDAEATIHYTTDGSAPTAASPVYTSPLTISKTTLLRAAEVKADTLCTTITTATYLFTRSVLSQSNTPAGYPELWGAYTDIWGTAVADYEMDPEMTNDPELRTKIAKGLKSLPILSIVSDKDNFFSHENDSDRGGIYIYTGPPVGDPTGNGWTRPASVELFGGAQGHDLSVDCGVRLHGGHGRLAEKNPKHSFRLVFKKQYGPGSLEYPLFGSDEPDKFNQLVVRCHFGNSWQHWSEANRQKAQYTRDVWARRMQRRLGHTSVNALYVHLFLNGMYWGMYNIAERVDDQFGKDHLGGKKSDIDVVKIEEDGGNHIEAAEGDLTAYEEMVETAARAAYDEEAYQQLQGNDANGNDDPAREALLDIDGFIDYMLINQYAGNTDWDHHNWYAIRRRGAESQGFRFLCWDSEIIFENENENTLRKNNGYSFPTGIFNNLIQNQDFARRYLRRAKELLAPDGGLGQESVVEVWDSLYHNIADALYDEAARWGDYRRDVHQWQSKGQLYTVDHHYMAERKRLLENYFPVRSDLVLSLITNFVDIDDFEAPADWSRLTADMFHEWDGSGADAQPTDKAVSVDWKLGSNIGGGGVIAGFVGVEHNRFADLSPYDKLVLRGSGSGIRILVNRLVAHGPWKQLIVSFDEYDPYWDSALQAIVVPVADLTALPTNEGKLRDDDFVHLNAVKVDWNSTANVKAIYLTPRADLSDVSDIRRKDSPTEAPYYDLHGRRLPNRPTYKGIYIRDGKKVIIR